MDLKIDLNFAWPTAEIAVMGGAGAVNLIHKRRLLAIEDEAERDVVDILQRGNIWEISEHDAAVKIIISSDVGRQALRVAGPRHMNSLTIEVRTRVLLTHTCQLMEIPFSPTGCGW